MNIELNQEELNLCIYTLRLDGYGESAPTLSKFRALANKLTALSDYYTLLAAHAAKTATPT